MSKVKRLPARSKVKQADTWDLSALFPDDDAWETAFAAWGKRIGRYAKFQGTLRQGAKRLAACLKFSFDFERAGERLGSYAMLRTTQDTGDSTYQRMAGRYVNIESQADQASSFIRPEILAIPTATLRSWLSEKCLAPYRLVLERMIQDKPHTLGKKEEKLLAMQTEMAQAAGKIFGQLTNADMKFGTIRDDRGELIELTHASFSALLRSPKRSRRKKAFCQYFQQYADHQHALAASLNGSMQCDIYYARARKHDSAIQAALFPDRVPAAVYDNLIDSVHRNLPALYRYYDVRRRKMRLKEIHHYDTYVPILADLQRRRTWSQAVDVVLAALAPLGGKYCGVLEKGLRGRWCDRYENRGKESGAFSAGSFDGDPYILMNYQPDVLDHVFTLAHEAGHSMHSYFSTGSQPFPYYNYKIFVAEVASTFNEQLLGRHLMDRARDDRERAFLVNREIDQIRGTLFRQTMFAEFEKITHALAESGEPLTLGKFREIYRGLLKLYFGPGFVLDEQLDLECFRIPHFYRAFYVYKYATGTSGAIALARRVLDGGRKELQDYLGFLAGGCSKDPLDLLRGAGVDMETPEPVDAAMARFSDLVEELDSLL